MIQIESSLDDTTENLEEKKAKNFPKKVEISLLTKEQAAKIGYEKSLSHPNYPSVSYYINQSITRFQFSSIASSYSGFNSIIYLEKISIFIRGIIYQIVLVSLSTRPIIAVTILIISELSYVGYYSLLSIRMRHNRSVF